MRPITIIVFMDNRYEHEIRLFVCFFVLAKRIDLAVQVSFQLRSHAEVWRDRGVSHSLARRRRFNRKVEERTWHYY